MAEKEAFEYQRTRSWGTVAISLEIKKKKGGVSPRAFLRREFQVGSAVSSKYKETFVKPRRLGQRVRKIDTMTNRSTLGTSTRGSGR